jgi:EPS-associated MarR family transcriptional regulator
MNEELRYRILRLLADRPEVNQRELAQQLGLSLGKTNYCLRALIEAGWIKVANFRHSDHKLGYMYVLTPSGLRARARATVDFLQRKQDEYARLEREIEDLRREAARLGSLPEARARE